MVLPADVVTALGLPESHRERARLVDGTVRELPVVTGLRIEILGRFMSSDAYTANPAHPDGPLFDLMTARRPIAAGTHAC